MSKSNEPIWWSLFAAGGMIAAFVVPVMVVITGIVLPFGLAGDEPFAYERMHAALGHPLIRLILFGLIALPFFHWAHRFRFTLVDTGLQKHHKAISVFCYGSAIIGTILTAVVLLQF